MRHPITIKRSVSLSALGVATVVVLAACGAAGSGSTGSSSGPAAESSSSQPSRGYNAADVMFAQMMIPHHQQAVDMSDIILAMEGVHPDVADLATRIKGAQGPEIGMMTGWLEAWGEPVEVDGGMEGHHMGPIDGMGGMLSEDEMAELEAARGEEAARIFLESMTAHHQGAVDMAREEIRNGENAEAVALAEAIAATQDAEILEMAKMLEELPAA